MFAGDFGKGGGLGFALAFCLLLGALTFRALLPAGYMLDSRGDAFEIVLCGPDAGVRAFLIDETGQSLPGHDESGGQKPESICAFAGVVSISPDEPSAIRPVPIRRLPENIAFARTERRDLRNTRDPPPLRGPPAVLI